MNILIGNKLKKLRKTKTLSQEEMADLLYISQSAYARMENGTSCSWANHIVKICEVFKITPEELVRQNNFEDNSPQKTNPDIATKELLDKIIEQYEERIKELKKVIKDFKKRQKT